MSKYSPGKVFFWRWQYADDLHFLGSYATCYEFLASLAFPIFDLERTTIEIQLLVLTTDLIANDCLPLTSFQYFSPSHLQFRSGRWVQTRLRGHCHCHNHTPR